MKKFVIYTLIMLVAFNISALTIFQDTFDSETAGIEGFVISSTTYVTKYTGATKVGTAAMQLKYGSNAVTYINTAPFKDMVLTFKMAKYSLETGEKLICQYYTGSTWVTCATLLNTATSSSYYSYSVNIPLCSVLRIKFVLNGTATDDYGYVDNVVLTGNRK